MEKKLSQREGVFNAVTNVMTEANKTIDGAVTLTKEERAEVIEIVAVGIHEGEIAFSDEARTKYDTFDKIKKEYVPGLVNNWLRKDPNLNGGTKYIAKNPGSRAGAKDDYLTNLRNLKKQLEASGIAEDDEQMDAVNTAITARLNELKIAKVKTIMVNTDLLPDNLKGLVK